MEGIWLQDKGATWGIPKKNNSVPKEVFLRIMYKFYIIQSRVNYTRIGASQVAQW